MSDVFIPRADHVSRYCGGSHVDKDHIDGAAFQLRQTDRYLSVNWLEYLRCTSREFEINEVRTALQSKLQLGSTSKIAVLSVGNIEDVGEVCGIGRLQVLHEQEIDDLSHSGIHGYTVNDDVVADELANSIEETYDAIPHRK